MSRGRLWPSALLRTYENKCLYPNLRAVWPGLTWPHLSCWPWPLFQEGLSLAFPGGLCMRGSFCFQLKLLPSRGTALSCQAKQHFRFQGLPSAPEPRRTFQAPFSPLFILFLVDHVRAHSMNSAHGKGRVKTDCCPRTFLSGCKSFVCSLCVPRIQWIWWIPNTGTFCKMHK